MNQPKTPQQILDKAREEFDEKLGEELGYISAVFMSQECKGIEIKMPTEELMKSRNTILDWHTSTLRAFIEAEIVREEGEKRIRGKEPYLWDITSDTPLEMKKYDEHHKIIGFNQAKEETITHYKELK